MLREVLAFVRSACLLPGVQRIALVGSLTTSKPIPKDADLLVTIEGKMDLERLAVISRRLKGRMQGINLGADIFLADESNKYIGRICHYKKCFPRVACRALHCGQREHLKDDLEVITLSAELVLEPPIELWPRVVTRVDVPSDTNEILLKELVAASDHRVPRT